MVWVGGHAKESVYTLVPPIDFSPRTNPKTFGMVGGVEFDSIASLTIFGTLLIVPIVVET
jgi:hypothetical protein